MQGHCDGGRGAGLLPVVFGAAAAMSQHGERGHHKGAMAQSDAKLARLFAERERAERLATMADK